MNAFQLRIFGSALLFAGMYGAAEYKKRANFTEVTAYLESIEDTCHLEKIEGTALNRQREITEQAPCHIVEPLAATHPGYIGYTLIKTTYYTVSYQAPDGTWQMGKLPHLSHTDGREMKIGEKTPILMHNTDPKKIRKI